MTCEAFQAQYAPTLTPQQQAAVQATEGAVLLLAVPGSGKTTVLIARLGYLIHCCGASPREILSMTYTVSAAADMKRRFAHLFGEELAAQVSFRTINGVCAVIIQEYIRTYRRPQPFTLLSDEKQALAILREVCRSVTGEYMGESDLRSVQTAITFAKNCLLDEEGIAALERDIDHFPKIYEAYKDVLRKRRLMDYDDQLVYAWNILRKYPQLLQRFQNRFRYFCVDEAQDTSLIQHRIISLLSSNCKNLFMVGDEDQSIYGFRAAYPEALLHFEEEHPGGRVLLMEDNFRSTPPIVAAADRFIAQNEHRRTKHMRPVRSGGSEVRAISVADRQVQYRYLLKVAQQCQTETAVLYRDNDCALPLIDLLERNRIPYRCRQMDFGFFSNHIVRDLTDILCLSENPDNKDAFLRVYYKLGGGISRQAAEHAAHYCGAGESLFATLSELDGVSDWTRTKCYNLHNHLINMRRERADRAVFRIVHLMGYGEYLEQRQVDPGRASILEALGAQEPSPMRLLERLDELRILLQNRQNPPDCPFILSTIHSSKGLEYERVFLMDVVDGILPKDIAPEALEEERRLFYVGMTRAKNSLSVFSLRSQPSMFTDFLFPVQGYDF